MMSEWSDKCRDRRYTAFKLYVAGSADIAENSLTQEQLFICKYVDFQIFL